MRFTKFILMIVIAEIIFIPIDAKLKWRLKFHSHTNKRFRRNVFVVGLLSTIMIIVIGFISDSCMEVIKVDKDFISPIFGLPLLAALLIARPNTSIE